MYPKEFVQKLLLSAIAVGFATNLCTCKSQCPERIGKASVIACLTLLALLASLPPNAGATEYVFTRIADTTGGVFSSFPTSAPSINHNGTLAFVGEFVTGDAGVFTGSGGPLTTIVDTIDHPEFGGFENPFINDNGTVVFIPRDLGQGAVGIFKGSGGALTKISDVSVGIGVPSINNAGTVAFAAASKAILTGNGGPLQTIADTSDDLIGFRDASIDNAGTIRFFAEAVPGTTFPSGGNQGIFTGDENGISILIDNSGPIVSFGPPVAFNDAGVALFEDRRTGSLLTSDGIVTTVVVDGSSPLGTFGSRSINNAGAVAFIADAPGFEGNGIFTGPDPVADKVILDGDSLFGRPVHVLAMTQKSLNDSGQIAFLASFRDGTSGIFRADPIPIVEVSIDIKPGSDQNSINCTDEDGVITVAILTTDDFDATTVDHTTVTFEAATEIHLDPRSGEPRRHEEDVDRDGDIDLVCHFRLGDTDLSCDSTEGTLTGETFDGQSIEGTDSVNMVGS